MFSAVYVRRKKRFPQNSCYSIELKKRELHEGLCYIGNRRDKLCKLERIEENQDEKKIKDFADMKKRQNIEEFDTKK